MIMNGIVSQSNFLPWRGYFASARKVETVVFYDSQQFTRRDWRNRNILYNDLDFKWLTLPLNNSGNYSTPINRMQVADEYSIELVLNKIRGLYSKHSHQDGYKFLIDLLMECRQLKLLSEINCLTTTKIAEYLDIDCKFTSDSGLNPKPSKNQKIIQECKYFGITKYFTGPSALEYLVFSEFLNDGIAVEVINFSKLPKVQIAKEPSIAHWLITKTRKETIELTTFDS